MVVPGLCVTATLDVSVVRALTFGVRGFFFALGSGTDADTADASGITLMLCVLPEWLSSTEESTGCGASDADGVFPICIATQLGRCLLSFDETV